MKKCSCVHSYTAGGSILCDPSIRKCTTFVVHFFISNVVGDSNHTVGAIFERAQWAMKRKCCVAAVKNCKE